MRTELTSTSFILLTLASFAACSAPESDMKTAALVADNAEIATLEQDLEGSLEEPLSGASTSDVDTEAGSAEEAAELARENSAAWFRPAGCLQSVRDANVVTHTFDDCVGPRGRSLNGVVTSTWTLAEGTVSVLHETEGFRINRARVDHSTTVEYRFDDGRILRDRTSSTVGETGAGKPIDHSASFSIVYDVSSGCYTREGLARVSIGDHEWTRTVEGWMACGDRFTCPSAGTITMSGPRGEGSIEITSSGYYDLTIGDRTDTDRAMLWCVPE